MDYLDHLEQCATYSDLVRFFACTTDTDINNLVLKIHGIVTSPIRKSDFKLIVKANKRKNLVFFKKTKKTLKNLTRKEKVTKLLKLSLFLTTILKF